jgi:hypothetical protein
MEKINWSLQIIEVENLQEWKDNPRKISKKDFNILKNDFLKFNQARTLTVSPEGDHFIIIGGNQSKKALQDLKYKTVQCSVADRELTESEIRELSILLNHRTIGQGSWDYDILKNWDVNIKEVGIMPEKVMAKSFKFDKGEVIETKLPYPVTIIITANEYEEWIKIKEKIKKTNDRDAFFKVLKQLKFTDLY